MTSGVLAAWGSIVGGARFEPHTYGDATGLVTTADGRRYVLKRVRGLDDLGEPRMRLAAEFRILVHLAAASLPVALPIVTDEGSVFAEAAGLRYMLLPCLASADGPPSVAAFHQIGVTVARLHRALAAYPHEFPSWRIDLVARTFSEALDDIATRLDPDDAAAVHRALARRRAEMVSALSGLPEQRIHGDCHLGNIVLSDEKVTGLIDLDHLPIGPKIYDLAYLLANHAADDTEQLAAITAGVVTGYRTAGTLDPRELAAVVPAMFAIQLQLVGWVLGNAGFAANASAHLTGYFWINEHYDELRAAVR